MESQNADCQHLNVSEFEPGARPRQGQCLNCGALVFEVPPDVPPAEES
jgi:hypothetical protein